MYSWNKADQRRIQLALVKIKQKATDRVLLIGNAISRKLRPFVGYLFHPRTLMLFRLARLAFKIYQIVNIIINVIGNLL
jgi:hypothetical protein